MKKQFTKIIIIILATSILILPNIDAISYIQSKNSLKEDISNIFYSSKPIFSDIEQPLCIEEFLDWLVNFILSLIDNIPFFTILISLLIGAGLGIFTASVIIYSIIMKTPNVSFIEDSRNKILTVEEIDKNFILWDFIDNRGNGSFIKPERDLFMSKGDQLINCTGEIILYYMPTNEEIGSFFFI